VYLFDPQPSPAELPARMPSPFDAPAPLARRAAAELQARLAGRALDPGGKMLGVLVVAAPDGRIGYLAGFSGMLGARWQVDGFVPPLFDVAARAAFWPDGERELGELAAELDALEARAAGARAARDELAARHQAALDELRARHAERRRRRHQARAAHGGSAALDQESRADAAERRRLLAAHAAERAPVDERLAAVVDAPVRAAAARAERSRHFLRRLHDTYRIVDARGRPAALRDLFAPDEPPGGAGDCAGPKLLGAAYREGLRPIALAELWWGPPPATGGRHAGHHYPSCRGKCGPILAHMLGGLDVEPAPRFGGGPIPDDQPRVVFEDDWLVVVDKPCGLLSVPGRHAALADSVLVRMRRRHPGATVVHRLDLDVSGLMLVARDPDTHAALQRGFACREIDKRYVAWLAGEVAGERGTVALALRVDLDDRPRQLHDPVHGKPAVTDWQVLARRAGRTRVALFPRTGRTHQLRVHAAHPAGLGAPIVGDRLYGAGGERLLLHAEGLAFAHPRTGQPIVLESPAPF
jgi:tRNA pseudouridine32 synthase/23S rRNA pseudouridine746 synthase